MIQIDAFDVRIVFVRDEHEMIENRQAVRFVEFARIGFPALFFRVDIGQRIAGTD